MHTSRAALALGALICGCANVAAGDVVLPSDISVALVGEPSINLQSGQRIMFTLSATNHGPEPVADLVISSSPIYDELDVFTASVDCENNLGLAVVDLEDSFYFLYVWRAAFQEAPLAVGETRDCYLSVDFTPWAPTVFPITFAFANYLSDLDPSNNSATVFLRRPVAIATPVPTLSPSWLGLFGCLLVATAWVWRTQSNARPRPAA